MTKPTVHPLGPDGQEIQYTGYAPQPLFQETTMIYGHDRTIHRTHHLNVEVGPDGRVVAVWFRCLALPFTEHRIDAARAADMDELQADGHLPEVHAVHVNRDPGSMVDSADLQQPRTEGMVQRAYDALVRALHPRRPERP